MNHLTIFMSLFLLAATNRAAFAVPEEVKRVIHTFDFEERQLGNVEELPMNWAKVQGPGMPHYVNGKLSTDLSHSGRYSFRLDLNGGSVAYRYDASLLHVMNGAHYRVEAMVRTTVMPNARACVTAYMADQDGKPLLKTVCHSEPYAAHAPDDDWRPLAVELSANDPRAAYLVVEIGLLQPALYATQTLGSRQLNAQDIHGTAWFDDISISQIPRVVMTTDHPANVFKRGEPVRLIVQIDDRFTDDLAARILVTDAEGKIVYQRNGTAELNQAEQIGPSRKRLPIDIPDLPAGFYRVALAMSSHGQRLGGQTVSIIQLADANPLTRPDGRIGFIATKLPFDGWDDLPRILPMLSGGRVKLALWSKEGDIQQMEPGRFDLLLQRLQEQAIAPTACLLDLPPELLRRLEAKGVGPEPAAKPGGGGGAKLAADAVDLNPPPAEPVAVTSSWPLLLRADPNDWQPQLAFLVARHANHLSRWQIGEDGSDTFVANPKMRQVYAEVYKQFRKLIQRPNLAMPWPAWYELDAAAPSAISLSVPPAVVLPSQVPLYLNDAGSAAATAARQAHPGDLSVALAWLDRDRYGRQEQLRDLAQRVIYTLSSGVDRIDLPLPMTVRQEGQTTVTEPTEEFIILRTLITTLGGAAYRGKVPIADGIDAFLFDRAGQGILALWDRSAREGVRDLAVNLGPRPLMLDLWGNVTPLQKIAGKEGLVSLTVGRMPTFLVDVDGQLMQTRASVALDRPLIESSFQPHTRKVKFTNGYRTTLSGTLRLRPPAGWTINPPSFSFSLNPGETFERDVTIELPYNSVAGPKAIDAQFALQADGNGNFAVPITVNLGLSDVGMQTIALRDGDDIIVQQTITNYGEKPIDYTAFAVYPGQSRQERLITGLAPGGTALKRYKFTSVPSTKGGKVRIGLKEMEGMRILNDEIAVQ